MAAGEKLTIEVDAQAAEILLAASLRAIARGETLGSYLRHTLVAADALDDGESSAGRQREAWGAFVQGMTALTDSHLAPGYVADDSRESMYDDRG